MVESWPARLVGEGNGRSGWVGYAVQTAASGGSELLIFVLRTVHSVCSGNAESPGTLCPRLSCCRVLFCPGASLQSLGPGRAKCKPR